MRIVRSWCSSRLSALCQKRIESLVQQAGDCAAAANGNPVQYRRAEIDLTQARQLAVDFHLDTQLIDSKMTSVQQMRNQTMTPVPVTAATQVSQMQYQGADAPRSPNPNAPTHGNGHPGAWPPPNSTVGSCSTKPAWSCVPDRIGNARRLAEAAFSGPYGVQEEAAQVLRSIDAEEFNQRLLAANRTYEAAMEAYDRHEYPRAATMLRTHRSAPVDARQAGPAQRGHAHARHAAHCLRPGRCSAPKPTKVRPAQPPSAPGKAVATDITPHALTTRAHAAGS